MTDTEPAAHAEPDASGHSEFHIKIDRTEYSVRQHRMTGAELRRVPPTPITADRDLFEIVPGHPDRKVDDDTVVEIANGDRFFTAPATINPGHDN